ncbi:hypothetical protein [Algoriphagus sp. A40]|uniref:hypothetical protein n=1 Tax=Algoriphagus sp. A40 TaxID=1945863 RepID=UPI0011156C80|nr:hypothetical protein [Algoriphagus sp. A40]
MTFLLILMLLGFNGLFAQEQELVLRDTLSAEEIKLVGVWKVDLPEQKSKLDSETKAQVDQLDGKKQEFFWRATESRVFALDNERNFVMTWVDEGSHNEVKGKWKLDSKTGVLSLISEDEVIEYQVEFNGKGQIWIPIGGDKKGFNKLYIKGLGI